MSESRTFHGITEDVLNCVKQASIQEQGTVYEPPEGTEGLSTTQTIVGKVVISYSLDTSSGDITYRIVERPVLAPEYEIWKGIENALNECR